jgi:hypothetical protein
MENNRLEMEKGIRTREMVLSLTAPKQQRQLKNSAAGIYKFRLTVTDNKGGISYDEMTLFNCEIMKNLIFLLLFACSAHPNTYYASPSWNRQRFFSGTFRPATRFTIRI